MTDSALMAPWPRRPRRLAGVVIEELVDRLVGGEIPVGEGLPIEPVLCETFGVSRTVLREAIKAVETMGLISVQQGQGTRIRPMNDWDLLNPTVLAAVVRHDAGNAILADLVAVRRSLEAHMASQAATNATDEERALITQRMRELDMAVDDPTTYAKADVAFHDSIMAASRNRLGRAIIHKLTIEAYRSLRYWGASSPEHLHATNEAHLRVHDAVLMGDAESAASEMDRHIIESWERRRPGTEFSHRHSDQTL